MYRNHCHFASFRILTFVVALLFTASLQAQNNDAIEKLKKYFTNVAVFDNNFTQEKVYLHLDNNGYFLNEKIWFKAYVFRASTLLPTSLSKVLYVELVTPEGEVISRKILPINNGRTYGDISLENIFQSGYYEIRAYTRAMLNWDSHYIYSRVVPIFEAPADSSEFSALKIAEENIDNKLVRKRPFPTPLVDGEYSKNNPILSFYPEGGHIVKGISNRVAYKLTDKSGIPLDNNITICTTEGKEIATTKPQHEGMGRFNLPADWNGGYAKITNEKGKELQFTLPETQEKGCAIEVGHDEAGNLILTTTPSSNFGSATLGLTVTCRGALCYFDTLQTNGKTSRKTIARKALRDGIQQVTLFTTEGEVIAERLAWAEPRQKPFTLEVKQNESTYQAFAPIVLEFMLKDADQKPHRGEFSLSVQDVNGMLSADISDIRTDMLLCSDLKGYIHQPQYYFQEKNTQRLDDLDLLLMVQGWRRYEWKEMAGVQPFELKQPAEDEQLLDGRITDLKSKMNPLAGVNVNLMMGNEGRIMQATAKTDENGNFAISIGKEFYGESVGFLAITDDKDNNLKSTIVLNRNFRPQTLAYEPLQLQLESPQPLQQTLKKETPITFHWTDTLPKIHYIPEVKVQAKDKSKAPNYGARFTYMGGAIAGKKAATVYYNVEDELESMYDSGKDDALLWDWLASRNKHFSYDMPTIVDPAKYSESTLAPPLDSNQNYKLTYKLRDVILLRENKDNQRFETNDYLTSEISSLAICEDPEIIRKYCPEVDLTGARPPVMFMLYCRLDKALPMSKRKGMRVTTIRGYSGVDEFYSPNYRMEARPTDKDLRRTLYWSPNITTDENGKASVLLFNNARKDGHIHVNAQGISDTGSLFINSPTK